jgi:Flp pilus assembly protein TadD
MRPRTVRAVHLLASVATAALLALSVAGCKTTGRDVTGSIGGQTPRSEAEWRRSLDVWGDRYRTEPGSAEAAIGYARALRATEQRAQAVAVLQQATMRNPRDMKLLGAYGRALADAGEYKEALDALTRAHTPDDPDWKLLNAQGAVLDQMGRHKEAQGHYSSALKIKPNEPSVLSNLGLSYALTKDLKRAERTLARALEQPGAEPKVRQNLALVIGLQGRMAEAEKIAAGDLPPGEAATNIATLRHLLEQQSGWKKKGRRPHVPPPDAGAS